MGYYSAILKNEIMPFEATRMDPEIIILSKGSQTEREILYDITYMWNLNISHIVYTKRQKQSCRYREQSSGY